MSDTPRLTCAAWFWGLGGFLGSDAVEGGIASDVEGAVSDGGSADDGVFEVEG